MPLQHQPINRTCATDVVEFVVPELDFTTIEDDADDTRTHDDDEIRRSMARSVTFTSDATSYGENCQYQGSGLLGFVVWLRLQWKIGGRRIIPCINTLTAPN